MNYSDLAKNKNQTLKVTHVATGKEVEFPAFIKEFSDSYDVTWDTIEVYGRMDPVKPYSSTKRMIQVAIDVLAASESEANSNFEKYGKFIKMLYPVYSKPLGGTAAEARTIKAPPLLRVKMMNYIQAPSGGSLLGCISGLKFNPKFDSGHYVNSDGTIVPTVFDISFQFTPLHEEVLGFDSDSKEFLASGFPYNAADAAALLGDE